MAEQGAQLTALMKEQFVRAQPLGLLKLVEK